MHLISNKKYCFYIYVYICICISSLLICKYVFI
nr:MAG TPA: hypothetical protein [Caudoviricetes sp.]